MCRHSLTTKLQSILVNQLKYFVYPIFSESTKQVFRRCLDAYLSWFEAESAGQIFTLSGHYAETCKFYMYTYVLKTVVSVFLNSSAWFGVWAPVFSLVYQYFSV